MEKNKSLTLQNNKYSVLEIPENKGNDLPQKVKKFIVLFPLFRNEQHTFFDFLIKERLHRIRGTGRCTLGDSELNSENLSVVKRKIK